MSALTGLLTEEPPYSLLAADKTPRLLSELNALTQHHSVACVQYQRLLNSLPDTGYAAQSTAQLPYLSVRLFKQYALQSVPDNAVFKTLYSSGTTGQPSRIVLDKDAAALQSRVLVRIMQHWLGKDRLPMLIIDHPGVVKDRSNFSARGAGIQGLAFMGRNHCYALNEDLSVNTAALTEFCLQYGQGPVLIFGFTFMVWHWLQQLTAGQIQLPQAILLHSGGWKKLQAQAVGNTEFKARLAQVAAIQRVHNFYGMVEQIGAVFVECEHGEPGVLQLLSTLPRSYPGHSLLTEDRGVIIGEDNCPCGRAGKYFQVLGRLAMAEARGCSDTVQAGTPSATEQ